jgi:hypothetical protein
MPAGVRNPNPAHVASAGHFWLHHREPGFDQLSKNLSRNTARSQEPFLTSPWRLSDRPESAEMMLAGESRQRAQPSGHRAKSPNLEINSGRLPAIVLRLVLDLLTFVECGQPSSRDG